VGKSFYLSMEPQKSQYSSSKFFLERGKIKVYLLNDCFDFRELVSKYDLCLTGDGLLRIMTYLDKNLIGQLTRLLPHIVVFARMAPKQKEWIINGIKNCGYFTLMCGDGTNDVSQNQNDTTRFFFMIMSYKLILYSFHSCTGWCFETRSCWSCHPFPLP